MAKIPKKYFRRTHQKREQRRSSEVTPTGQPPDGTQLYTAAEASARLRISLRNFEDLVKAGKIPPIWVSKGKRLFDGNDLEGYLQRQKAAPSV